MIVVIHLSTAPMSDDIKMQTTVFCFIIKKRFKLLPYIRDLSTSLNYEFNIKVIIISH